MATLDLTQDNKLILKCTFLERELAKKVQNYTWNKQLLVWIYPFSKEKVEAIKKYFPDICISEKILAEGQKETLREHKLRELRNLRDIELPEISLKAKLFAHQRVGIHYLSQLDCAMLADDLGMGKSLQSLALALLRKQRNEIIKTVIVCPATTKFSVWKREIEKFTDEKCIVIDGDKKKREVLYHTFFERDDVFFLIVNYESLTTDSDYLQALTNKTLIISDEAVYIKNRAAQRTKAIKKLTAQYRVAVTGYPIANKIIDIHSQFDWIMPGFLGSFWAFQDRYLDFEVIKKRKTKEAMESSKNRKCKLCNKWSPEQKYAAIYTCQCAAPEWEDPSFKKLVGYKNLDELRVKLEPYYIRRLKKDVLDLPPKLYQEREVALSGKLLEDYLAMKKEMRIQIKSMDSADIVAKANTILTQLLRLSQLTCGFITDIKLQNPLFYKENPKIEALDDIIDEVINSGQKIVIWTRFRTFLFHILKRYTEGFIYDGETRKYDCAHLYGGMTATEKDENVQKFQTDDNCKIIIGTIQTGGMGITLHAGSVEVFTDLSFLSPSTIKQGEDRCYRIGTKQSVTIIKLLAKDTVDIHWVNLLQNKQAASRMIFDDEMTAKVTEKEALLELLE